MSFIAELYFPEDIQREFEYLKESPEESDFENEQEIVEAVENELSYILGDLHRAKNLRKGGYFDVIDQYLEVVESNGYSVDTNIYKEIDELKKEAA